MNFAKLKEKRNIILLVIFVCCIGGCRVAYMYDEKKTAERTEIIRQLPQLYSEEAIHDAIHAPETKAYLFVGHKFERCEPVKDPMDKLDGDFLYIKSKHYKWRHKKQEKGKPNPNRYKWEYQSELNKCGKIFMDKNVELEGFGPIETSFYNIATDEITEDNHSSQYSIVTGYVEEDKHLFKYEYALPSMQYSFIAELGNNRAKLGYNGTKILVVGDDTETLIKQTNLSSGLTGTKFILSAICVAILIFIYKDLKKKK